MPVSKCLVVLAAITALGYHGVCASSTLPGMASSILPGEGVGEELEDRAAPQHINDDADVLLDQIQKSAPQKSLESEKKKLVDDVYDVIDAKRRLDVEMHSRLQRRLREESQKVQIRQEFDARISTAQQKCTKWLGEKDSAESELQNLFEKSTHSSSLARDGARRGLAPVLVEKELHVADMSINALRCHISYLESLSAYVEAACEVSKNARRALDAYLKSPTGNFSLPSTEMNMPAPNVTQLNMLKLTAANAMAKVEVARHEYDVEKARVDAMPPLDDVNADLDAAAEGEEEDEESETPPHALPMDVLFKHITGRVLNVDPPKMDTEKLKSEKKRILKEQEDCFGKDCDDPKEYETSGIQ